MLPCLSHVQQARPYRAETGREGPRWPRDRPAHHSGKSLARWRADLIADLGGEANVTTQMNMIVDLAVKTKLILDSVDTWLLTQPSLIDRRRRAAIPVVLQRQQLADALARYMTQLGLGRRRADVISATAYIRNFQRNGASEAQNGEQHDERQHEQHDNDGNATR